jgi:hypothetical protein
LVRGDGVAKSEDSAIRIFRKISDQRQLLWESHRGSVSFCRFSALDDFVLRTKEKNDANLKLATGIEGNAMNFTIKKLQEIADSGHNGAAFEVGVSLIKAKNMTDGLRYLRRAAPWNTSTDAPASYVSKTL